MASFDDLKLDTSEEQGKTEQPAKKAIKICEYCGKSAKNVTINYLCPRCKQAAYCGKKCAQAAWSKHEGACQSEVEEEIIEMER